MQSYTSQKKIWIGRWLLGVALMPDSGFWLAFPPAIGLLRIKTKPTQ